MAEKKSQHTDEILQQYRAEIDAIDAQLIALMHDRQQVVSNVGALKAAEKKPHSIIRPGREATMVRAIASQGDDKLPGQILAHIWRQIISAAINLEESTNIAVVGTTQDREAYWLTREHFGAFSTIQERPTDTDVTQSVLSKSSTVGVISIEETGVGQPWWRNLCDHKNRPMVFARLPFIRQAPSNRSALVALGYVTPEATADDESLWAFYVPERVPEQFLQDVFNEQDLSCTVLDTHKEWGTPIATYYLLLLNDYVEKGDKRITTILRKLNTVGGQPHPNKVTAEWLGAYATPLRFYDEAEDE